jgi:hypothetical protein
MQALLAPLYTARQRGHSCLFKASANRAARICFFGLGVLMCAQMEGQYGAATAEGFAGRS